MTKLSALALFLAVFVVVRAEAQSEAMSKLRLSARIVTNELDVAALAAVESLRADVPGIASNVVTRMVTNSVAPVSSDETYPVLVLPLGGQWTDFELKASTNNFTNLCYYVMSHGTNIYTTDTNVWVYYADDYSTDVRQWLRATNGVAIGQQLVDPVNSEVEFVVVNPSHECRVPWTEWMSRTNNHLVWSFVRYDSIGLQMNATGTKTHWSPVVPVEWRAGRISP